jgi:hypothetical protein
MEVIGTPANLAIAEYVHAYLRHASEELWTQHRRGPRRTYLAGVMHGFLEKLREERAPVEEERALVWVKDAELEAFYARRHPKTTSFTRQGQKRDHTFHEGKSAGKKIVLKRGVGAASSHGRLLGDGK